MMSELCCGQQNESGFLDLSKLAIWQEEGWCREWFNCDGRIVCWGWLWERLVELEEMEGEEVEGGGGSLQQRR